MKNQNEFYGLLGTLKEGAEIAGTYALGALGLACEGAEKLADAARLRYRAAQVESELNGELKEAGELAYAAYGGDEKASESIKEKMRTIDVLKIELEALNDELGRTPEEEAVCPTCGAPVDDGDHFCRVCGVKLD